MDSLFRLNSQSDDFVNCLDFRDANVTDEEMMWFSSDLLNYQPLLNDCMLSQASGVPVISNAKDVMISACSQTFIKDEEFEHDLLTLVNPNMAMTLDKEDEAYKTEEQAVAGTAMTEVASFSNDTETEMCVEESLSVPTVVRCNPGTHATYVLTYRPAKNSILKPQPQTIALAPRVKAPFEVSEKANQMLQGIQKVQIRLMPRAGATRAGGTVVSQENIRNLPLSPPNSDSDGSVSPVRSERFNIVQTSLSQSISSPKPKINHASLLSNSMPSGSLFLSEEEERTLISEGYPVPTKWPLTKQEEKILKKIQRKIKNKVSAQESRRKKKDYIDSLEKRLEVSNQENSSLKKKVEKLEHGNRVLMSQIEQLKRAIQSVSAQTSTYVTVFILFFAIFLGACGPLTSTYLSRVSSGSHVNQYLGKSVTGELLPFGQQAKLESNDYKTPSMKSRTLLSVLEDQEESAENLPSSTCYSGMLNWMSLLHTGPKMKQPEQPENMPALPVVKESEGQNSALNLLENQTEWKSQREQMPSGVDMIYTSDFITFPASES